MTPAPTRHRPDVRHRLQRLAVTRRIRFGAAVRSRFGEIDGANQGVLVSVQLFTTVIPLMILGFGYFEGFAENASPRC